MELDGIFSGGGVKGIALVGALSVFEEQGYRFIRHAGTSAGAIVGGLHAAGYSADELKSELFALDYPKLLLGAKEPKPANDPHSLDEGEEEFVETDLLRGWARLDARVLSRIRDRNRSGQRMGLFPSTGFEALFRQLLEKKGIRTFKDLRLPDAPDGTPRYRAQMVGADVTRGRLVLLPEDIVHYRDFDSPDDLPVALAMRISMSIPAFFRPVVLERRDTGAPSYLVDGGLLSRFPIAYFATNSPENRPAIGFRLERPETLDSLIRVRGPFSLLLVCALTAIEAHDARLAESDDWRKKTVLIPGQGIPAVHFLLSDEQKTSLYEGGVRAARAYLANPDARSYLARFHKGECAPGR
jgi:NTE family protein